MGLLLKLVQVPLDGILSLRRVDCTAQLGVICIILSLMKILSSTGPNMEPCGTPLVTNLHLEIHLLRLLLAPLSPPHTVFLSFMTPVFFLFHTPWFLSDW